MPISYEDAAELLAKAFEEAEAAILSGTKIGPVAENLTEPADAIIDSRTQAFREALLGCLLASLLDESVDVRKPYVAHGENSYNGRTLDEKVVNPALKAHGIQSSKGPFLSVFRRSVQFVQSTREGLRDKSDYDAFLSLVEWIEVTSDKHSLMSLMRYLAFRFVELRESSAVALVRIKRMSLEQILSIARRLSSAATGGLIPVYLVVAGLRAIDRRFGLDWEVSFQGINVADSASGVGGDIVVSREGEEILVAEVTERIVDQRRVNTTFSSKVAPHGIRDYLFFVTGNPPTSETLESTRRYFAQGHEIDFVVISEWLRSTLATIGQEGRNSFLEELLVLLELAETSAAIRHLWNESVGDALQET